MVKFSLIILTLFAVLAPGGTAQEDSYLASTELIDSDHRRIRDTAEKLSQGLDSPRDRAIAIHGFVRDHIDYGFGVRFYNQKASDVLRSRTGFCVTKTTLFIALLRAANIPARQRFVEIDTAILKGIIDPGTPWLDHSFAEVRLGGVWIPVDSYIVDPALFHAAQSRLEETGELFGYGVHRMGTLQWDGFSPSFSQFVDGPARTSVGRHDLGIHRDVAAFYANSPHTWNEMNRSTRTFFVLAVSTLNSRIGRIRAAENLTLDPLPRITPLDTRGIPSPVATPRS